MTLRGTRFIGDDVGKFVGALLSVPLITTGATVRLLVVGADVGPVVGADVGDPVGNLVGGAVGTVSSLVEVVVLDSSGDEVAMEADDSPSRSCIISLLFFEVTGLVGLVVEATSTTSSVTCLSLVVSLFELLDALVE